MGAIDLVGNEIDNMALPLAPATGSFVGQICRNASFYPVIWDGSAWVAPSGGSGYAYKNIIAPRINSTDLTIAATSTRNTLKYINGNGIALHGAVLGVSAGLYINVDTSKVRAIPSTEFFVIPSLTNDTWITLNGGITASKRYFDNINTAFTAVSALAIANPSNTYKITVYPGNYTLSSDITIYKNMILELMPNAVIINSATSIIMQEGYLIGEGNVEVRIEASSTNLNASIIECHHAAWLDMRGQAIAKCNDIDSLSVLCYQSDVSVDAVRVDNVNVNGNLYIKANMIHSFTCTNEDSGTVVIDAGTIVDIAYGYGMSVNAFHIYNADFSGGFSARTKAHYIQTAEKLSGSVYIDADIIGYLECVADIYRTVGTRIRVGDLARAVLGGEIKIEGGIVRDVVCLGLESKPFDIKINVNEIGNVRTVYGWSLNQYQNYALDPQVLSHSTGLLYYCQCDFTQCNQSTICTMRPYLNGRIDDIPDGHLDYTDIAKSRLSIIANRRTTDSVWYLAVGTTSAHIQQFEHTLKVPHTYVSSVYDLSGVNASEMTILRVHEQNEIIADTSGGYQIGTNAALVLDGVNSRNGRHTAFTANSSQLAAANCSIKSSTLNNTDTNILGLFDYMRMSCQTSYGNTGTSNVQNITGSSNLIINTTHNWM